MRKLTRTLTDGDLLDEEIETDLDLSVSSFFFVWLLLLLLFFNS